MIWTKKFWKGLGERAIKTFFQSWVAAFLVGGGAAVADAVAGTGIISPSGFIALPWIGATTTAIVATLISATMSIGNADFTAGDDQADSQSSES